VSSHAFGERTMPSLRYAAMLRASQRWCGRKITNFERTVLAAIREKLDTAEFRKRDQPAVQSVPSRILRKAGP